MKVISLSQTDFIERVYEKPPAFYDTIGRVIRRFKWEAKLEKDEPKVLAEIIENGCPEDGNDSEYIERWIKKYESGNWLIWFVENDDTGGGWYIGKLKRNVRL